MAIIGRAMRRLDADRLVAGRGEFIDDVPVAGALHVAIVRSTYAHARIRGIDTAEVLRQVAILVQPFMPEAAAKLLDLLAIPAEERQFRELGGGRRIAAGKAIPTPSPVFPRYVDGEGSARP